MGVVLLIKMVYVGIEVAPTVTGMKPLKKAVCDELGVIGTQGASNVDCVTV